MQRPGERDSAVAGGRSIVGDGRQGFLLRRVVGSLPDGLSGSDVSVIFTDDRGRRGRAGEYAR